MPIINVLSIFPLIILADQSFGWGILSGVFVVIVLLFFSALVSGSEIAFFSLKQSHLQSLKESKSSKDHLIVSLLSNPRRLLGNIIIANNFINVAIVILLTFMVNQYFDLSLDGLLVFLIEVVFITSLLLFFGEILPKVLATHKPLPFARFMAGPLQAVSAILYPLTTILVGSTSLIDKRIARRSFNISMDDLSHAIDLTTSGDGSGSAESETSMLRGIVRFGDTDAHEIMRSRLDVTAVEENFSFSELLKIIHESGFSRIPVFQESFDKVVGILYIKDLLPYLENPEFEWQKLIRPAYFVPENKPISDLLKDFQKRKIHMAIVVDEYGGTSGIVTLEDVIEEIVGDINDEFDVDGGEFIYSVIDNNTYIFDAKTSILDFCRIVAIDESRLNEFRGDAETIAGIILEHYGRIPVRNEEVSIGFLRFRIESSDNRRIKLVKVFIDR